MDTAAILGLVGALIAAIIGVLGTSLASRGSARRAAEAAEIERAAAGREAQRARGENETRRLVGSIAEGLSYGAQLRRQAAFLLQDVESGGPVDIDRFDAIERAVDQLISIVRNVVVIGDVPLTPAPLPVAPPAPPMPTEPPPSPLANLSSSTVNLRRALIQVAAGTVPSQRLGEEVDTFEAAVHTVMDLLAEFQGRLHMATFVMGSPAGARRLRVWPMMTLAFFLLISATFLGLVLYLLWPR
ncbi:hypothetical protein [Streptomyces sp. NPDC002082]|uniref:hypothetical protein n=1 Tax=Streptomyces sp. NPDC002082 TaxID=3154772 RepID=UPI00332401AA